MDIQTFTLHRSGITVLAKPAKECGGDLYPVSYANISQSQKKANELRQQGWDAWTRSTRPFYVIIGGRLPEGVE